MADLFDAAGMYDEDYLHFFASPAETSRPAGTLGGEAAAELTWRLLDLRPGLRVLDLACGHGDLAHRLAARGCRVTGLDSSAVFLDRARADAAAAGTDVEYVAGDMRRLPWTARFDRVVNWSTAFGYFDDDTNRDVLRGIAVALRPGGRLAMDLDNLPAFLAAFTPSRVVAARDDGDLLVDRYRLDALTGRLEAERTVVRDGRARRTRFVKRLFGFPELRDWLIAAGFAEVAGFGEDGTRLTADHRRMVLVAALPS
ncbi:SAM-dependent methyltransferase [Amycolatopsis sp. cmx-4-61]|uniref:SAM-dependent methyltransferase n=1 Tax=Amycolatopsis sp. cmx-4-61 TaxID=2790937 RepID=UPI00397880B7